MYNLKKILLTCCIFFQLIFGGGLQSKEETDPSDLFPKIREINLEFNGFQNVSNQTVFSHIQILPGQMYDQIAVSQSIRALYNTRRFKSIQIRSESLNDNAINLTFVLEPRPNLESICFDGNFRLTTRALMKQIDTTIGGPLDEASLNSDVQKMLTFYHKKGFANVSIKPRIVENRENGTACVTLEINEGTKIKISKILFCGHKPCKSYHLKKLMTTKRWTPLSFITGKGRFNEEAFQEDIFKIKEFYKNKGYLDVDIPESNIIFHYPRPDRACITININKGMQYHVGCVTLSGNTLYSKEKLFKLLTVSEGDVFSPECIEQSTELLRDAYGQVGYLDTFVVAEERPNLQTGCIDLNFIIHESDRYCLESIKIQGNTRTKSNVILRELALAPGDVFDLVRMKSSQRRLENTRYFKERSVSFIPEETDIPGRRNLLIALEEGRTGHVQFSATYSSVESLTGTIELSESNFDLFNYRNKFKGGGQKIRLRTTFGKKSRSFSVSFIEPWVCERELLFGTDLFYARQDYLSKDYDKQTYGFDFYFRKRLFNLIDGQLMYSLTETKIFNISDKTSDEIKKEAGTTTISKLGLIFSYDTRDNLLYPNRGWLAELSGQVAGGVLGGNKDFTKVELSIAKWTTICTKLNQTLLVGLATGSVAPFNNKSVPFFERFLLGGPDNLRGFDLNEVGPRGKNDRVIGGGTMARATVEYSIRLMDQLRFATFYDWGFVNSKAYDWNPSKYNDNWGVGFRIFILGAPIRLDWGFPIKGDGINNRNKSQFHFSFGTTF